MTRAASFSLLGVGIRIDASWILLALLIAWSLASGVFPGLYAGLPPSSYWAMAAATVVGVAASIILHELGHTLVARAFGLPIKSITLFVFGGVAEMEGEPKAPMAELLMALAGPLVSVALGFGFAALANILPANAPTEFHAVAHYLSMLNYTLAVFNMLPAFPLDGGRVLRAIVWLATRDPLKATRIAARSGEVIAILLMAAGVVSALGGGIGHGLWWVILGWFILSIASAHRREAEAKQLLSGARVRDLMTPDPVTAPADMSVAHFVETVLARHPHDLVPIMSDDGAIIGGAGFGEAKAAPRESWASTPLSSIATPIAQIPTADQRLEIEAALERMQRAGASRLIVTDGGRLAGILTLKDLANHLRFRSEFAAPAKRQSA
ncbi:MAG: putative zinc metalloprotease Rip3 [Alphaproteobacteria bacterium]|nr:MAG: putative zinc metalloprotease Rip3 [Alphaproteobacteria bacterium]